MKIIINGEAKTFTTPPDLAQILAEGGFAGMTVAVARNGVFVPRAAYGATTLTDGDDIEIVAPMQGG